jgi:hypothetical protein
MAGTNQQPYLNDAQKALAKDTFETTVAPLREDFNNQFNSKVNDLSGKGILFGGLGNDLMARTLKDQAKIEGDVAANIGVNLGKTALDQAYQANEAAKSRQFSSEQSQADRSLQTLLADKGYQFQTSENALNRNFQGGESGKDRSLQTLLQEKAQTFQGDQAKADRSLQSLLQDKTLSAQERQQVSEQAFQSAFQKAGFVQQADMFSRQEQAQNNINALNLALSGNLSGDAVQGLVDKTLGKGFMLKSESQTALEGAAAAAGLSVDEFNQVRSAMAKGQIADMFTDNRKTITYQPGDMMPNPKYDPQKPETPTAYSGPGAGGFGTPQSLTNNPKYIPAGSVTIVDNKNYGKNWTDADGNPTINPAYIASPDKAMEFQKSLAQIYANAQMKSAQASANAQVSAAQAQSSKVICTELYRQRLLPHDIWVADMVYSSRISPTVVAGYHAWGVPLAQKMRKNRKITRLITPFGRAWAYHMAYKVGAVDKPNRFGAILEAVGIPLCYAIGILVGWRKQYA